MTFKRLLFWLTALLISPTLWCQYFIENKGQWPSSVLFRAEIPAGQIYLEEDGIVFDLQSLEEQTAIGHAHATGNPYPDTLHFHAYKIHFPSSTSSSRIAGAHPSTAYFNFLKGNDPDKWGRKAKGYAEVTYSDWLEGVDLRCMITGGVFKYEFILSPGVYIKDIYLQYEGISPELKKQELHFNSPIGQFVETRPISFQYQENSKQYVESAYVLKGDILRFKVKDYDKTRPLTIDPSLVFSTYSGSTANNFGYTATFDSKGFLYSGSSVFDFEDDPDDIYPTSMGAYQVSFQGGRTDIALSKFDTTGTFLIWSTYLGGSGDELPHSIIVSELDELYLFGTTSSADFPTTASAFDSSFEGADFAAPSSWGLGVDYPAGPDIIVSRLEFDGSDLIASTFVGDEGIDGFNLSNDAINYNYADEIRGEIELDHTGNVIIATTVSTQGDVPSFPTSIGAPQPEYGGGTKDGILFSLDADLEEMMWSTFIGGAGADAAFSLAFTPDSNLVVCGGTNSIGFPTTENVLHPNYIGGTADAWVVVLDPIEQAFLYSTFWGTDERDQAYMVETDNDGNVHLFGQTHHGDDLIIDAIYADSTSGQFISKLSPELDEVVWSTTFGNGNGIPNISPTAFLVDHCERIYLSGWGGPTGPNGLTVNGLETTEDAFQSTTSSGDFYLMALADDASELLYASYYGGSTSDEHVDGGTSRFDKRGKVYQAVCAGCQNNSDLPIEPSNALSSVNGSIGCNLGVFKMDFDLPLVLADFIYTPSCLPDSVHFLNNSEGGLDFVWDFGDGSGSTEFQPSHLYSEPGYYQVSLLVSDPMSCNLIDSVQKEIFVFDSSGTVLQDTTICADESVVLGIDPIPLPGINYSWTQSQHLDDQSSPSPTATVSESTLFTLTIDNGQCPSTATQWVYVDDLGLEVSADTIICDGESVLLSASSPQSDVDYVWSVVPSFSDTLSTQEQINVSPEESTTYYLSASKNCQVEEEIDVWIFSSLLNFEEDKYICAGEPVLLQVDYTGNTDELTFHWEPDAVISSGQGTDQVDVLTSAPVWVRVEVAQSEGCSIVDSSFVDVSPLSFITVEATAQPDQIAQGESTQLQASPSPGYMYSWTPAQGLSSSTIPDPLASPTVTTIYTVTVMDLASSGSCSRSDSVLVSVFEYQCAFPTIFLPNAFSPNGDEKNDILYVRGRYLSEMDLKIYDRWGEMVYHGQDKTKGWDGTFNGKELEPAVYVYHLEVTCIDGQVRSEKGNVTLIR